MRVMMSKLSSPTAGFFFFLVMEIMLVMLDYALVFLAWGLLMDTNKILCTVG